MDELMDDQQALMERYGLCGDLSAEDLVKVIESIEKGEDVTISTPSVTSDAPIAQREEQPTLPRNDEYEKYADDDSTTAVMSLSDLVAKKGATLGMNDGVMREEEHDGDDGDDVRNDSGSMRSPPRHTSNARGQQRNERVMPRGAFRVSGSAPSTAGTITGGSTVIENERPPHVTAELVTEQSLVVDELREQIRQEVEVQVRREMQGNIVSAQPLEEAHDRFMAVEDQDLEDKQLWTKK